MTLTLSPFRLLPSRYKGRFDELFVHYPWKRWWGFPLFVLALHCALLIDIHCRMLRVLRHW